MKKVSRTELRKMLGHARLQLAKEEKQYNAFSIIQVHDNGGRTLHDKIEQVKGRIDTLTELLGE